MNEPTPEKSLTRSEQLTAEIERLQEDFKREEEAEARARNNQHWIKKRIKVAKDELTELSNA